MYNNSKLIAVASLQSWPTSEQSTEIASLCCDERLTREASPSKTRSSG